jgi:hypothetical protein
MVQFDSYLKRRFGDLTPSGSRDELYRLGPTEWAYCLWTEAESSLRNVVIRKRDDE